MINPVSQLMIPEKYLKTLSADNISVAYYNATTPPKIGFFDRIKMFLSPSWYYKELENFYPHHPVITKSYDIYQQEIENSVKTGLALSAASVFLVFQFARRGKVLPVLRQYGKYFHTHRIFRQYLWAWALPIVGMVTYTNWVHNQNVAQLWQVHARRLQKRQLEDPDGSIYSQDYTTEPLFNNFSIRKVQYIDRASKSRNEGPLTQSDDYTNPEFEAVDMGEEEEGGDQGGQKQEGGAEEE